MSDALPQPSEVSDRDKEDAMGAYLMVFGAIHLGFLPFLGLIMSWIYHGINGKKSAFVGFHSFQSLLFSIPAALFPAVWVVWGIVAFFDGLRVNFVHIDLTAFWVFTWFNVLVYVVYVIYSIVGAVQSRKGRLVYFPVFGRLAYDRYFGAGKSKRQAKLEVRNEPPKGL